MEVPKGRYQDGIQQPTAERVVDVPKISCQEKIEADKDVPQERISERTETLSQDRPLQRTVEPTQIREGKFEVYKIVLPERILEKNCTQIEVRRERVLQWTAEQIGDAPPIREETVASGADF